MERQNRLSIHPGDIASDGFAPMRYTCYRYWVCPGMIGYGYFWLVSIRRLVLLSMVPWLSIGELSSVAPYRHRKGQAGASMMRPVFNQGQRSVQSITVFNH